LRRFDIAEHRVIVGVKIDPVDGGDHRLAANPKQSVFHIAQDFGYKVITLQPPCRAGCHMVPILGLVRMRR